MSTVGHFISMIGVFCFYTTLLESSFERKLTPIMHNLVPRLYIDTTIVFFKNISVKLNKKKKTNLIAKKSRIFFNKKMR